MIDSGWTPFLRPQAEIFKSLDLPARLVTLAALGGWGSSKTTAIARALCKLAMLNPKTPAYGQTFPLSVVMAPTNKILRSATMRAIEKVIPKGALRRVRGTPHNDWLWANGHLTVFWSAEAEFEGVDICGLVVDEVSHRIYQDSDRWMNMVARVRDPLSPRMAILVAGLPEQGWVRDTFEIREESKSRVTVLSGMEDNLYLPIESIEAYRANCPAGQEDFFLKGRWRMPEHAVYSQFNSSIHVSADELERGKLTHAAVDFGEKSHILVYQESRAFKGGLPLIGEKGLLFGEEIHMEKQDSVAQAAALRKLASERGWVIGAGSIIDCDPTGVSEQKKPFTDAFPGARVIQTQRGDRYNEIEDGIRVTQRAMMDSTGVSRVRFSRRLMGRKHGAIDAIQSYRRNPQTQKPIKDNLRDHAADCFRYACARHLPELTAGWSTVPR